jgi:hypothetical protein
MMRHATATAPIALAGNYSGYAMTPSDDEDYDFIVLTGNSDHTYSTLITMA